MTEQYNILSVDWDYFFPNVLDYDWGHREESLFIEYLWSLRPGNKNLHTQERAIDSVLPDKKLLTDFWERVVYRPDKVDVLMIGESHKDITFLLKGLWVNGMERVEVINFDQHHDITYSGGEKAYAGPECGNWAGWGISNGYIRNYHLFYPPWREKNPENVPEIKMKKRGRLTINYDLQCNYLPHFFNAVFICRSGAWTPPWADKDWLEFINWWKKFPYLWERKNDIDYIYQERKPSYEEALVLADQYEEMLKNMRGITV